MDSGTDGPNTGRTAQTPRRENVPLLIAQLKELRAALENNTPADPFWHCFDLIEKIARETNSFFHRDYPFESRWSDKPTSTWGNPFKVSICELEDDKPFIDVQVYTPDGALLCGYTGQAPLCFIDDGTSLDHEEDGNNSACSIDPLGFGGSLLHSTKVACDRWIAVLDATNSQDANPDAKFSSEWRFVRSGDGYDIAGPSESC